MQENSFDTTQKIKTAKYSAYLAIVLAIVIILTVNVFADYIDRDFNLQIDTSKEQFTALSEVTKDTLGKLDADVYLYYIGTFEQQDIMTTELLKNYASFSSKVHYGIIDPDSNVQILSRFKDMFVAVRGVIVSDTDAFRSAAPGRYAVLAFTDLYSNYTPYHINDAFASFVFFRGEQRITSAINYVEAAAADRAVFLTGQDEVEPCSSLLSDINGLYFKADFQSEGAALDPSSDTLIVISPREDISIAGYSNIKTFLESGGHAIFFIDSLSVDETNGEMKYPEGNLVNFKAMIGQYGLSVGTDIIIGSDPSKTFKSPANIIPTISSAGAGMLALDKNLMPVLSYASSINLTDRPGVLDTPLLITDDSCYSKTINGAFGSLRKEPSDKTGPFIIGAIAQKGDASLVIYSSPSFIVSEDDYAYQGNSRLFLNTLSYLSHRLSSVAIPVKTIYSIHDASYKLNIGSEVLRLLLIIFIVAVLPLIVLTAGISRRIKRRSL